eukprot:TRINITY_DN28549_c0_g1_i1.p1 TRINITY_DN28549_c0_g1~~TRINITY_DN28549_c0_g1_i1.p1  ORF type:complete len:564 (+),score=136.98 TRINITY_DN28549_c0_g1_i1:62-1693(+)
MPLAAYDDLADGYVRGSIDLTRDAFAAERGEVPAAPPRPRPKPERKPPPEPLESVLPVVYTPFQSNDEFSPKLGDRMPADADTSDGSHMHEEGCCGHIEALAGDDRVVPRSIYACTFSFCAYAVVYNLRSPWRAATYDRDRQILGVDFKDALTIAWTLAYFLGKALSAPVLGGLRRGRRVPLLMLCLACNLAAWGLFAAVPQGSDPDRWVDIVRVVAMAASSVPLAFFWGTFFRYLEGRDYTELLGACMSAAIIVGSGTAKSIGSALVDAGLTEETMPIVAGAGSAPFIALFCLLIDRLPEPTESERALRGKRRRMSPAAQREAITAYWPGLVALWFACIVLTALRDYRDVFTADMWKELNDDSSMPSWLFTTTEVIVAAVVLLAVAAVASVRDNQLGFQIILGLCAAGFAMTGGIQLLHSKLWDSQEGQGVWLTVSGVGVFLGYVPVSAVLYDRLVGALRIRATSVYFISVSDVFGYIGSVGLLLFRNYDHRMKDLKKHEFFKDCCLYGSAFGFVCVILAWAYFRYRMRQHSQDPSTRPVLS